MDDCAGWYWTTSRCPASGGWNYDDDDFTAGDMCCTCGGGAIASAAGGTVVTSGTLTGAGGGGFLLLVTKEPDAREAVRAALADEQVVLHDVSVDEEGLRTRFEAGPPPRTHPQE